MNDAGKAGLSQVVGGVLPQLQESIDKLSAIPGVGNIIKSSTDEILASLAKFTN